MRSGTEVMYLFISAEMNRSMSIQILVQMSLAGLGAGRAFPPSSPFQKRMAIPEGHSGAYKMRLYDRQSDLF
jgi:hypothetical protein